MPRPPRVFHRPSPMPNVPHCPCRHPEGSLSAGPRSSGSEPPANSRRKTGIEPCEFAANVAFVCTLNRMVVFTSIKDSPSKFSQTNAAVLRPSPRGASGIGLHFFHPLSPSPISKRRAKGALTMGMNKDKAGRPTRAPARPSPIRRIARPTSPRVERQECDKQGPRPTRLSARRISPQAPRPKAHVLSNLTDRSPIETRASREGAVAIEQSIEGPVTIHRAVSR
jgi:hypothetical protein